MEPQFAALRELADHWEHARFGDTLLPNGAKTLSVDKAKRLGVAINDLLREVDSFDNRLRALEERA